MFALVLAYLVAKFIVTADYQSLMYIGLVAAGATITTVMLGNWRNGVYLLVIWLLFEDFARKFLGNNMAIYFAKDALTLIVLFSFLSAYRRKEVKTFRPPFLIPLLVFIWFAFMQVFNPASTSIAYGLMGMKLYFFYIPLAFMGYSLFDSERRLRGFLFFNLTLGLLVAALGIAQAIIGPTFLNPAVMADDLRELGTLYRMAPLSGELIYRPTSVFVSDGRFGSFMIFSWIFAFGICGYLLLRGAKGRLFSTLCLGVLTVAVVLSGSRGALLWTTGSAAIIAAAFFWGSPWRQSGVIKILRTIQRTVLIGAIALVMLFLFNPGALHSRYAFYWETLSPDSSASELAYRARDYPLQNFVGAFYYDRWVYGYGLGTCSLGTQYVTRFFHAPPPGVGTENGYGQILLETGIFGLILWVVMTFSVVWCCWKVTYKMKGSAWFPLAASICWYVFLFLVPLTFSGLVAYQNFIQNAYLWLLIGILFKLPSLELSPELGGSSSIPGVQRRAR